MGRVLIFDTTLRDGLKAPGTVLTVEEKIRLAKQLARLKVDILEAGFPAASEEQYEACEEIANEVHGPVIAVLARATNPRDFEMARKALKKADRSRIHTHIPASRQYREHFLKKSIEQTLNLAATAVQMGKKLVAEVELSLVDAFRADPDELIYLIRGAIEAGADTINLADTVGRAVPLEVTELFQRIKREVPFERALFAVHCHNDLGMAVANSLAAVSEGVAEVHCTINGIGERAGNTATEELIAALVTRPGHFNAQTNIRMDQIYPTSRLVARLTGIHVQSNKPVVGANAFTVESVVPQLADTLDEPPYRIIKPETLGIRESGDFLSAATPVEEFEARIRELGYELPKHKVNECYASFKELAANRERIFDADLELLVSSKAAMRMARYKLVYLNVTAGSISVPNATVQMEVDGETLHDADFGHGPIDAAFKTICKMARRAPKLVSYEVLAVTPGSDAQGQAVVRIEENGHTVTGRSTDKDIILASAKALVDAFNKLVPFESEAEVSEFADEESWMPRL